MMISAFLKPSSISPYAFSNLNATLPRLFALQKAVASGSFYLSEAFPSSLPPRQSQLQENPRRPKHSPEGGGAVADVPQDITGEAIVCSDQAEQGVKAIHGDQHTYDPDQVSARFLHPGSTVLEFSPGLHQDIPTYRPK